MEGSEWDLCGCRACFEDGASGGARVACRAVGDVRDRLLHGVLVVDFGCGTVVDGSDMVVGHARSVTLGAVDHCEGSLWTS